MSHQVVSVKREVIAACMTCTLCHKLLKDATTISECLHTFCRKCIFKKLSDGEYECCPICNIHLGCVPLEKLRPDHSLQDVRAKIFPYKRRKVEAPEVESSFALPVRRNERSHSSLVVSAPRVSKYGGLTGRRSKYARKAAKGSAFSIEKPIKKQEDSEDLPESSRSSKTMEKFTQSIRQNSSAAEPLSCDKADQNNCGTWDGKFGDWNPLTCIVEAENRSKESKIAPFGSSKSESTQNGGYVCPSKLRDDRHKLKFQDAKNSQDPSISESKQPKKLRKVRQKKTSGFGNFNVSPQTVLDGTSIKFGKNKNPVWFSLVASDNQEGDEPLPQISASYLRIKDGNIPVSFIQKYLVRKLDLRSEDEVEILCMGRAIFPTWQLNHLVDLWLQTTSSDRVSTAIGSSAKEFVMVLAYARRVQKL